MDQQELVDRVGCTVAHLGHVLEQRQETIFRRYVNEWRVNYAATLLTDASGSSINIGQIAIKSGFADMDEFDKAFQSLFGMSAEAYSHQAAEPANTG